VHSLAPFSHVRMVPLEHCPAMDLCGNSFPCFRLRECSFVLLNVCISGPQAHPQLSVFRTQQRRGQGSTAQEGCVQAMCSALAARRGTCWPSGADILLELILLSLFSM